MEPAIWLVEAGCFLAACPSTTRLVGHEIQPHAPLHPDPKRPESNPDLAGQPHLKRRTSRQKRRNSLKRVTDWGKEKCRDRLKDLFRELNAKLRGYDHSSGVNGNSASLQEFFTWVTRILCTWLNRRSQRRSSMWTGFRNLLHQFRVERPHIVGRPPPRLATGRASADLRQRVFLKSPVRENRTPGSVRGRSGHWPSYRDDGDEDTIAHRYGMAPMITIHPVTLEGHGVRLEPLAYEHHDGLAVAAADGRLWELWFTVVPAPGQTRAYIADALAGQEAGHMLPWAVRELTGDTIIGSTRYHDIVAAIDRVEIGSTWYAKRWQRSHVNTACKLWLLGHAFDALGCKVVGLRTDHFNFASQRAIEALGAKKDGIIRHHRARRDGTVRDTVIYSILASEWPDVKRHLELRLTRYGSASS